MDQGEQAPAKPRTALEFANVLRESTKSAVADTKQIPDKQPIDDQGEALEANPELEDFEGSGAEDPTPNEELDEDGEETTEDNDPEGDESESEDGEPQSLSIEAEGVYVIDGQEIDGQTILNGIEATKNFAQEKHKLRLEAETYLGQETEKLSSQREEYANATRYMMGLNQQAYQQIEQQLGQATDPNVFRQLREQQQHMRQAQQQLSQGFEQFQNSLTSDRKQELSKKAKQSLSILRDEFGADGWPKRYGELRGAAKDFGFSESEFLENTDHRFMILLDKASKLESLKSTTQQTAKKKLAKTVKETRKRNSQRTNTLSAKKMGTAKDKFSESRKPIDAAAMWLEANTKRR